jgi:hypothetical protein
MAVAPAAAAAGDNFVAKLSGGQEVPTRDTQAVGVAKFKLREDGAVLLFKVNVANIDNTVAAHIHCGDVGVNGPVGVTNGTLAEGTITAPDVGNACGWTDMTAVLAAVTDGGAYVNVHTNDGVAPPNTGPRGLPWRGDPRPNPVGGRQASDVKRLLPPCCDSARTQSHASNGSAVPGRADRRRARHCLARHS